MDALKRNTQGAPGSDEVRPKRRGARTYNDWTIPDAAARFHDVVQKAEEGPQILSDEHGLPAFVVVSIADWQDVINNAGTLFDFFQSSPLRGVDLDIDRRR